MSFILDTERGSCAISNLSGQTVRRTRDICLTSGQSVQVIHVCVASLQLSLQVAAGELVSALFRRCRTT